MTLNPEFRRNLWLELTLQRLVAMPFILGLVFGLALLVAEGRSELISVIAQVGFYLLVLFWGCRRAAASVATEVREGTWDWQRMSALGPWGMAWGKLLGSTAFVWYGALLCLAALIASQLDTAPLERILRGAAMMLAAGLLAQAVSLAAALAWLRKMRPTRRLPVTLCQILGIIVGVQIAKIASGIVMASNPDVIAIVWYRTVFDAQDFILGSLALFLAWGLLATYRLMQAELQVRIRPWTWLAFTIFLMVYLKGVFPDVLASLNLHGASDASSTAVPYLVGIVSFYAALFLEPKDIVRGRILLAAVSGRDWRRALYMTPVWLPALVLTVALGSATALSGPVSSSLELNLPSLDVLSSPGLALGILAQFGFMLRDLCLVLLLNFGGRRGRADLAAGMYLVVLYIVLPWLVSAAGQSWARGLFLPFDLESTWLNVGAGWAQGLVLLGLLILRWQSLQERFQATLRPTPGPGPEQAEAG